MATDYWDYWNDATGYTGTATSGTLTTGTATTGTYTTWYDATSSTPIVRKMLVRIPESWGKSKIAAYTKLINDDTNTGWTVEMIITGDIKITDHSIEVREMKEFVMLLKQRASQTDRHTIDDFFKDETWE